MPDADHSGRMPRLAVSCSVCALAGCAAATEPGADRRTAPPPPGAALDLLPPKDDASTSWCASEHAERAAARRDRARAALADGRGVAAGRAADRADHARRGDAPAPRLGERQRRRSRKLTGVRRTELGYVVGTVRSLAARHTLTTDRLEPTFLVLRTNARFWPRGRSPPPAGGRARRDPAIFQYYPGRGLQLQPLASWGRANAIAGACLAALRSRTKQGPLPPRRADQQPRPADRARRAPLRLPGVGVLLRLRHRRAAVGERDGAGDRGAGALARLPRARRRAGGGGARARSARSSRRRRAASPCARPGGRHYVLYSFAPVAPRVQRRPAGRDRAARRRRAAALQAREAAVRARRARGAARGAAFDTGAWSLYSERGAESTLGYHALIAGFLAASASASKARTYCRAQALRALRARADADRHHPAAAGALGPDEHGPLHALEGLRREGARVGHARDEPLARPPAAARQPHGDVAAAGPRPLPAADRGARPERAARRRAAHDPRQLPSRSPRRRRSQAEDGPGATMRRSDRSVDDSIGPEHACSMRANALAVANLR